MTDFLCETFPLKYRTFLRVVQDAFYQQNLWCLPRLKIILFIFSTSFEPIYQTLFFMRSAAAEPIKRSYYELFIFVHQLFWIFFPLLWIHGSDRIIKRQINLDEHNPEICSSDPEIWGYITAVQCPHPRFEGLDSSTPYWIMTSVVAYFIEIILRIVHTFNRANIDSFKFHSGSVLEIRLRKNQFSFR